MKTNAPILNFTIGHLSALNVHDKTLSIKKKQHLLVLLCNGLIVRMKKDATKKTRKFL